MTYALTSQARSTSFAAPTGAWARLGRISGYIAGACFLAGTVLFLLDATHVLAAETPFHQTAAGPLHDEANWWVAYFARQHHVLWDVITRDTLFPVAFVALMVVALAIRRTVQDDRPEAQLLTAFVIAGGLLSALSDLLYLSATDYWRMTGWTAEPATRMVSIGRSSQAIESLTRWPEAAGFVVLAAGLVCMGRLAGRATGGAVSRRLAPVVYLEAFLLLGIAVAGVAESDTAYNIFSLLTGAVVGPVVAVWLGVGLGRTAQ
jgi:hypothetical protein